MTNKEVLEGLMAGKIYKDKTSINLYRIKYNVLETTQENGKWWIKSDLAINNLNLLEPYEPAPEKPTWWKHEYYIIQDDTEAYFYTRIINKKWEDYKDLDFIVVKSTSCQADTIEEAVKILENIKGE